MKANQSESTGAKLETRITLFNPKLDANGYVAGVRCGLNHSGNDRLAGPTDGYYECCGCGSFFGADTVLDTQHGPIGGEKGAGGIYRKN